MTLQEAMEADGLYIPIAGDKFKVRRGKRWKYYTVRNVYQSEWSRWYSLDVGKGSSSWYYTYCKVQYNGAELITDCDYRLAGLVWLLKNNSNLGLPNGYW